MKRIETNPVDIGALIKEYREAKGLTIRQLANEAGVSASMVSLIESGERIPSVDILNKLLAIFDREIVIM